MFRVSKEYKEMLEQGDWSLIHALLGGPRKMREHATEFLPREEKEGIGNYETRLAHTFLFPGLSDTIDRISSKPFVKPIVVESAPEQLEEIANAIDDEGNDITTFAKEIFRDAMIYGIAHFFVDYVGGGETLLEEKNSGAKPVFRRISPTDLIGWDYYVSGGKTIVTEIVILEREKDVEQVRVITTTDWQVYRKTEDEKGKQGEWVLSEEGEFNYPGVGLPFVTLYIKKTGMFTAEPTFKKLAWLNLEHYQSASQQRNVLRFARTGLLCVTGASKEEVKGGVVVGANAMFHSTNPDAKIYYAEHSGTAIQAGERDLKRLEEQMQMLGLVPFISIRQQTATERAIDERRANTDVEAWVISLDDALEKGYYYASIWANVDLPDDFDVKVYTDFGADYTNTEEVKILILMRQQGFISMKTFLKEIKRRGVIDDALSVEEEMSKLATEPPEWAGIADAGAET